MATTFKTISPLFTTYKYSNATGNYTEQGLDNNQKDVDYFLDTATVGDALVFVQPYNGGKQYSALHFHVGTPLVATSITLVWEYSVRTGGSTTAVVWKPLQNVRDDTNAFQNSGANSVYWQMPDDWENYTRDKNQLVYYAWNVRARITAVSGLTEGGRNSTTKIETDEYRILLDSSETFDSLYNLDKAGTLDLDVRTGITTTDAAARTFSQVLMPADYVTLGGADLYLTVANWIGTTATIRLTGTDIDGNTQTEDITVTGNGVTNTTKVWKTMTASQVTVATVTSFDYTITQGQWGVLYKMGSTSYGFKCTLSSTVNGVITDTQKHIEFFRNWQTFDFLGQFLLGTQYSGDKTSKGVDFLFTSENNSLTSYVCWGSGNSSFRNCSIRIRVTAGTYHGYWYPFGHQLGDVVDGAYFEDNRQFALSNRANALTGTTLFAQHVEPCYGIVDRIVRYGASHGLRLNGFNDGGYCYDSDFAKIVGNVVNPYQASNGRTRYRMVDCIMKEGVDDTYQAYWNFRSGGGLQDQAVFEAHSLLLKVADKYGVGIANAAVKITNGLGTVVFTGLTNADGYINDDNGTATSGSTTLLTDTSKNWTVTTGYNADLDNWWQRLLYITSGTGAGQRRICSYGHTSTTQIPSVDFSIAPDNTSKYIIIPYVDVKMFEPISYFTNCYSIVTDLNPFTIEVTAAGYNDFLKVADIDRKLDETITVRKGGGSGLSLSRQVKFG